MNILAIDNEPKVLKGIHALHKKISPLATVKALGSAEAALAFMEIYRPDIVFTDIRMGGMSGIDYIKIAKELNDHVVFVIISGYDTFEYAKESIALGVVDFVVKPVSPESLKKAFEKASERVSQTYEKKRYNRDLVEYHLEKLCSSTENFDILQEKISTLIGKSHFCFISVSCNTPMTKQELETICDAICDGFNYAVLLLKNRYYIFLFELPQNPYKAINSVVEALAPRVKASPTVAKDDVSELRRLIEESLGESKGEEPVGNDVIQKVLSYIDDHYQDRIALNDIAENAYMSASYISKLFKKSMGMNISEYLTDYRIARAKELMVSTDLKIY